MRFIDPLDARRQPLDVAPVHVPSDPYGGPTPDLDDLEAPDDRRMQRRADARVAEVYGAAG